ncbi:hypothetical protein D3C85_541610 [compost metagenome]
MTFKKGNTLGFAPGNTLAKENNNQKKRRMRKSSMRKTLLEKLEAMCPAALKNLEDSVSGKQVDKEVLSTSKFVIANVVTVNKACVAEEATLNGLRTEMDKLEEDAQEDEPEVKSKFSLTVLPTKKDL